MHARQQLGVPEKPSLTFLSRKLASMFKLCSCREQTALSTCAICGRFSNLDSADFSSVATMAMLQHAVKAHCIPLE